MTKLQQWQVTLTDERTGPRGGKAKPVISTYVVAAFSREEALAVFKEECPAQIGEQTNVSVSETLCRVMRAA